LFISHYFFFFLSFSSLHCTYNKRKKINFSHLDFASGSLRYFSRWIRICCQKKILSSKMAFLRLDFFNFLNKLQKIRILHGIFFSFRKLVELGLFQVSELELIDRIAILTRISMYKPLKRLIFVFQNSAASAWEIRVNIAILSSSSSSETWNKPNSAILRTKKILCNIRKYF